MKPLRFLASWLLYGMGHCVSVYMNWRDTERCCAFLYPIYSRLLLASERVQGKHLGALWPWGPQP